MLERFVPFIMPSSTTNEKRTVVRGLGEIAFRVNNLDAMEQFYVKQMLRRCMWLGLSANLR